MPQSAARPAARLESRLAAAPPRLPGGYPLLGHMLGFGKNPFALMMRAREECGEIAEFRLINQDMVLLSGPEANEAFCRAPDEQLSQSEAYKVMTPIFGEGVIFDAPLERLDQQLGMLMPALRDQRMRSYAQVIAREVEDLIAGWGDGGEIDFLSFTKQLTLYTSSHCLLGSEFRRDMSAEFASLYHDLEQGVKAIAYIFPNLPLPSFRRRDKARVRLVEMISEIIERRQAKGVVGEDALQTLLDSRYNDGSRLDPNEITGMLTATMFAGHHTSAGTAAWTLIELLRNPQARKPVLEEIERVVADAAEVSFEALRELPQLDNVIKEVLRLHPPLIILIRKVMRDFHFKGHTVPAGKFLCISPAVSHRIPEVFPDPDCFDPDRYAEDRAEDARPFAWIAFGGGRHKCSGNAFALMQLKAIFAILLKRYEFELADRPESYQHDYRQMVVQPKPPCRVRYRRRSAPGKRTASGVGTHQSLASGATGRLEVKIDWDLCKGHAVCMGEAPEVFRVSEGGEVEILQEHPPAVLREKLRNAVKYCPSGAIALREGG